MKRLTKSQAVFEFLQRHADVPDERKQSRFELWVKEENIEIIPDAMIPSKESLRG